MHHDPEPTLEPEDLRELLSAVEKHEEQARDSTTAYLNEIGLIELLSAEDEVRLARAARSGDAGTSLVTSLLAGKPMYCTPSRFKFAARGVESS